MSTNSTPTLYLNLERLALEANSSAMSAVVTMVLPQAETVALGPTQGFVYDAGLSVLGPTEETIVSYSPVSSPTPRYNGFPTNLIEMARTSEFRTTALEFDIGTIESPGGIGYLARGQSRKLYVKDAYHALSEHESGGIFTTTSGIFVLPASPSSGVHYRFIRTSGPLSIYASGGEFWNNAAASGNTGAEVFVALSGSGLTHIISNGSNRWYQIQERFSTLTLPVNIEAEEPDFPSTLNNISLWLDASDLDSITKDGSNRVSQWNDKSGSGNHVVQSDDAKKPVWTSGSINDLNVIDFNGSSHILSNSTAGGTFTASSGEIWMVYHLDTLQDTMCGFTSSISTTTNTYLADYAYRTSTNPFTALTTSTSLAETHIASGTSTIQAGTTYIVRWKCDENHQFTTEVNGISNTTQYGQAAQSGNWFANLTGRDNFSIGGFRFNNSEIQHLNGKMCELIVIEGANLSLGDSSSLYNYLVDKWFSPEQLPGISLWLDASDLDTITKNSENLVSQWNDKSGRGNHVVQATASKKPTWMDNNINGLDSIDFQSSGILVNSTAGGTFSGQTGEVWIVFQPDATGANYMPFASADEASGDRYCGAIFLGSNNSMSAIQKESDTETIVGGGIGTLDNINVPYIARITSNGTSYGLSVNGVVQNVTVFGGTNNGDWFGDTTARDNFTIGAVKFNGTEANFCNGKMCEVVVIESGVLGVEQAENLYHYLKNKWVAEYPNLVYPSMWLDANDLSTITKNGSNEVSQWNDKGRLGRNVTASLTTRPTYAASSINGLSSMDFDGSDDVFVISEAGGTFTASSGEVWAVVQLDTNDFCYVWRGADDGSATRYVGGYLEGSPNRWSITQRNNDTADICAPSVETAATGTPSIIRWKSTGTSYSIEVNGVDYPLTAAVGTNSGDWFADTSARDSFYVGNSINGKIGELIVLDGVNLNSQEAQSLYYYLATKWEI